MTKSRIIIAQYFRARPATLTELRQEAQRLAIMFVGALVVALGYSLFQVPHNIAAGGLSGISIIVNHFTGWPVGMMYLVMNIPVLTLGYFYLGRWRFVARTVLAVFVFSTATDLFVAHLPRFLPKYPITTDMLLNALYGGIVGGVGGGLIYRAGSTLAGTGVIGRIIQRKTGIPLSQVYLYTDGAIILIAGLVFGWEIALYALLALFLNGLASDYTMEGPSSVRIATIITDHTQAVAQALTDGLRQGVSHWQITGSYTDEPHGMLMCTVYRSQVNDVKRIVATVDPTAFIVIGMAHQALGSGFTRLKG